MVDDRVGGKRNSFDAEFYFLIAALNGELCVSPRNSRKLFKRFIVSKLGYAFLGFTYTNVGYKVSDLDSRLGGRRVCAYKDDLYAI